MGFRFQVPGSRFQATGSSFQVPDNRFQVPGHRFQTTGSWFQVLGLPLCLAASVLLPACDKVDAVKKGISSSLSSSAPGTPGTPAGGGDASQATPQLTLQAYRDAIAKQDYDKLYQMMSGEFQRRTVTEVDRMKRIIVSGNETERREVVEKIRKLGMTPEEFSKTDSDKLAVRSLAAEVMSNPNRFPPSVKEVKAIKIEVDRATVTFTAEGGGTGTLKFAKEGGAWKIAE